MISFRPLVRASVFLLTAALLPVHISAADPVVLRNIESSFGSAEQLLLGRMLGKALFWDEQLGSGNGGRMACASCHYQAGADAHPSRVADGTFVVTGDFTHDGNPRTIRGSLGVRAADFLGIQLDVDGIPQAYDHVNNIGDWLVTDKNAPATVDSNSIHNFWDGRANNIFNGVDITGVNIPTLNTLSGKRSVMIDNASQASQAVGPVNSSVEMAAGGRTAADVGFKMLNAIPLRYQQGDVRGELQYFGYGTAGGYKELIEAAFSGGPLDVFISDTDSEKTITVYTADNEPETRSLTVTESNFSLFFGVSVALYEQSLESVPKKLPNKQQRKAFKQMRCDKCHYEDGRSHAVIGDVGNRPFEATGVEPLYSGPGVTVDALNLLSMTPNYDAEPDIGQFKSSHLLNLTLTAPYFHDGSAETLEDMLDFYVRGGDFNLDNVNSHVRPLDATRKEYNLVLRMMRNLTDPRIEAGEYPFAHPSLEIPLRDGVLILESSDVGGGLKYLQ